MYLAIGYVIVWRFVRGILSLWFFVDNKTGNDIRGCHARRPRPKLAFSQFQDSLPTQHPHTPAIATPHLEYAIDQLPT